MEYKRFQDTIAVRLSPGEEVCESLLRLAEQEGVRFASVSGIGATDSFAIGVYDIAEKRYYENKFEGVFEITSLLGTLTRRGDKPYLHLHMNAGDRSGAVFGGHLTRAQISATAEIVVRCVDGEVQRRHDETIGINLFAF